MCAHRAAECAVPRLRARSRSLNRDLRSWLCSLARRGSQVGAQELEGARVGLLGGLGVIVLPAMACERMSNAAIRMYLDARIIAKRCFDRPLRFLGDELVLLAEVQHERRPQRAGLAKILVDPAPVVGDRHVGANAD